MTINGEIDEFHEFQVKMAIENVKLYENLAKSSGWRWYDKVFFVWFPIFAVVEFGIMIWNIVDHDWWSAALSFVVGCSQIVLYYLNKRTKRRKEKNQANWLVILEEARKALETLDPTNSLVPLVIEEEP